MIWDRDPHSLDSISRILSRSVRLGTPLFFQKWFRRGPLRAGDGIPSSAEGISEICALFRFGFFPFSIGIYSSLRKERGEKDRSARCLCSCHMQFMSKFVALPPSRMQPLMSTSYTMRPEMIFAGWLRNRTGTGNRNRRNRFFSGVNKKGPGAKGAPEFVPESPLQKRGLWESYFLQGIRGKRHTQNLRILREDTLGATCSAGTLLFTSDLSRNRKRNRNRRSLLNSTETQEKIFIKTSAEEPPEPKTGTARTVPTPKP